LFAELKEAIDVRFKVIAAQSTDWHQDFGGSDVAQHLQLPLVWSGPAVLQTVADEFRAIGKQGVPEFVSNGVVYACHRTVRIEFNS
jgi:hypothetical protein